MQKFAILLLIAVGQPSLAADYEEVRDLSLNAEDIGILEIETGAGSLLVTGVAESSTIVVEAIIRVPNQDAEGARKIIESDLDLTLERDNDRAVLRADFAGGGWLSGHDGSIQLEVTVPEAISLDINDGSGSITVQDVTGDIALDDGSGSIDLARVGGRLTIDDGSGSIAAQQVGGDVTITDGSGSLKVTRVEGSVTIDDGSGGVTVSGIAGDVDIREAGSGSLSITDVQGNTLTGN
jgi:hypothetical protein